MDFTNIDKYHGTGAFNQTVFPQWDSIFLDYVSRPEEIIVMSVKQQQRRRSSLSGRNDYLEDMAKKSSSSSSSSNTQLPTSTNSPPTPRRGVTGSYLDSLSSGGGGGVDNKPKQQQQQPPPIKPPSPPTMKGSAMNYLESLSNPAMSSIPEEDKKPMGEITNNPYVEEVCCIFGLLFVVFFLCYYVTHKNTLTHISFSSIMVQKTIEYELEVDPSSIVRRILAVREQLSQEWIQDLDTLMQLNDEVMETYEEYVEQLSSDDYDEEDEVCADVVERLSTPSILPCAIFGGKRSSMARTTTPAQPAWLLRRSRQAMRHWGAGDPRTSSRSRMRAPSGVGIQTPSARGTRCRVRPTSSSC